MFEILYQELKLFLLVYRLLIATTRRYNPPDIRIESDTRGVRLSASSSDMAVSLLTGSRDDGRHVERFSLKHQSLIEIETGDDQFARFSKLDDKCFINWEIRGVPRSLSVEPLEFERSEILEQLGQPFDPQKTLRSDGRLLKAIYTAAEVADAESGRYALNALQLDGSSGSLNATDGRHAFVQHGFKWPWENAVLIPIPKLLRTASWLRQVEKNRWPVSISQDRDWLLIEMGEIKIALKIIDARFPNVDRLLSENNETHSVLELAESDAAFVLERIQCLPANDLEYSPLTIDLNGAVSLRASEGTDHSAVELVLSNSVKQGDDLTVCTNRDYLRKAIGLGFRRFSIDPRSQQAVCSDSTRTYIWGLLEGSGVVKKSESDSVLHSPVHRTTIASATKSAARKSRHQTKSCA